MIVALITVTSLVFLGIILITTTGRVSTLGTVLGDNVPQVRLRTAILRQRFEKAFIVLAITSALVVLIAPPLAELLVEPGYGVAYVGPTASAIFVFNLIVLLALQMVRPFVPKLAKVPRPPRPKWRKALVISGTVLASLTVFVAFLFTVFMFFLASLSLYILQEG